MRVIQRVRLVYSGVAPWIDRAGAPDRSDPTKMSPTCCQKGSTRQGSTSKACIATSSAGFTRLRFAPAGCDVTSHGARGSRCSIRTRRTRSSASPSKLTRELALRFPTVFLAIKDASVRIHDQRISTEHTLGGEYFVRYHKYNAEWFKRELPGLRLPRQYDEILADSYILAALDALERGDRRRCADCLRSAVVCSPSSLANPRLAVGAAALMLGRAGANLVTRARSARQSWLERTGGIRTRADAH